MELPDTKEARIATAFMQRVKKKIADRHLESLEGAYYNAIWEAQHDVVSAIFSEDEGEKRWREKHCCEHCNGTGLKKDAEGHAA